MRSDTRTATGGVRVLRLSRVAGLVLAVPVFLAFGAASVTAFVIGASALMLASRGRGRGAGQGGRHRRTITLGRDAYRHLDPGTDLVEREQR